MADFVVKNLEIRKHVYMLHAYFFMLVDRLRIVFVKWNIDIKVVGLIEFISRKNTGRLRSCTNTNA